MDLDRVYKKIQEKSVYLSTRLKLTCSHFLWVPLTAAEKTVGSVSQYTIL